MIQNSIVVAVYGESIHLAKCIESIKKNTLIPYNLIVIDTKCPRISLAKAWNKAISMTNSDIITCLNDDGAVGHNWLELLNKSLLSGSKTGLVSPTVSHCGNNYQVKPFNVLSKDKKKSLDSYSIEEVTELSKSIYNKYKGKTKSCKNDISGSCITFKKDLWERLGCFDESFFPAYGEDTDFYDRILKIGLKLIWCEESYFHHIGAQTAIIIPDLNRKFTSNLYWKKVKERKKRDRK